MTTPQTDVSGHYTIVELGDQILDALEAAGKDVDALTVDDLAPVDGFHIRGRAATEELARWADVQPDHLLLDVGCGLGGTGRYLAATVGCRAVGLDVTKEYCRVAEMLSARVGMTDKTVFRQGSALALPFADGHFDVVWTEHVQMNIADKAGFYSEMARVLKPGGLFAFHDIFTGVQGGLRFPVPWAAEPSINHLIAVDDLEVLMADWGFEPVRWEDKTEASTAFFEESLRRLPAEEQPTVGLHLLMGNNAPTKFANMLRNLEENRVRVVQAVMRRQP
jgi:SAM-dependent methyltransferase